jgi:hypothetical protein
MVYHTEKGLAVLFAANRTRFRVHQNEDDLLPSTSGSIDCSINFRGVDRSSNGRLGRIGGDQRRRHQILRR